MLRTLLALALASSAWADTICSRKPTACDGTYSGTQLCAPLHRPPFHAPTRGVAAAPACRGHGRAAPGGDGEGVGWWRRVGARHTAHLPPAADLMPPRAPLLTPSPAPVPLSQELWLPGPDRQRAHAARATPRADVPVSHRSSAPPPPSRGRIGVGMARRMAARRGSAQKRVRRTCRPLRSSLFPHDPAPAPLSQDPSLQRSERQLALAARAPHRAEGTVSRRTSAPPPPSRGRIGGGRARRAAAHRGGARVALAALRVRRRSPP